jgi:spore coat protein H
MMTVGATAKSRDLWNELSLQCGGVLFVRLPNGHTGFRGTVRRRVLGVCCAAALLAAVLAISSFLQGIAPSDARCGVSGGGRFFDPDTVWTARLRFEPDQWTALEPKEDGGPFGGPGRGPGRPGGPGGPGGPGPAPGGPPPMPRDFGPGTFVAPIFMEQGDLNHDKRLAFDEISSLADRWFTAWDKNRLGKLDNKQLRDGVNAAMMSKGPPGGFGGPPGGGAPGAIFKAADGKRNGIAGAMGINFSWVHADLEIQGQRFAEAAVRLKGNGTFLQSRGALKRSFKVNLARGFGGKKPGRISKLNFHSNVTDASWMNEVLSYRMYRDAGVPAPRTSYARVYLTVPGKYDGTYVGLYSLVENVDNNFAIDRFGTKKGALFKPVAHHLFEDIGDDWKEYRQAYDPKTPLSNEETGRVMAFCKLVSHASDDEFAAKLDSFLDIEEFSRFMAVTVWLSTMDSILAMDQNFVVYLHPKTRCFQFIPWDLDHSFGQFFPVGTPQQRENLSIHKPWTSDFLFLKRVFAVERFKRSYLARLKDLNETLGRPERLHGQVDEFATLLRPAVAEESAEKLARFDKVVAGEPVGPAGFGGGFGGPPPSGPAAPDSAQGARMDQRAPRGPMMGTQAGPTMGPPMGQGPPMGPPGMFGASTKPIKGFVTARHQSVRDQLEGVKAGDEIGDRGFGGPAPPAGREKSQPPGMPSGFGPGMFWAPVLMSQFDTNKDSRLTRDELREGFRRWFLAWDVDKTKALTEDQLRGGLNKVFSPRGFGPPGPGTPGMDPFGDPGSEFDDDEGDPPVGPEGGLRNPVPPKKPAAPQRSASDRGKNQP